MTRIYFDIARHEPAVLRFFLEDTWCPQCRAADLGLTDPREYEEDGVRHIVGKCRRCGHEVDSILTERDIHNPAG